MRMKETVWLECGVIINDQDIILYFISTICIEPLKTLDACDILTRAGKRLYMSMERVFHRTLKTLRSPVVETIMVFVCL